MGHSLVLTGVAALALAAAEVPATASETAAAVVLDRAALKDGSVAVETWRFRAGDDLSWLDPGLDDSAWEVVEPVLFRRGRPLPANWKGIGWLRARIHVAPDLVGALSHSGFRTGGRATLPSPSISHSTERLSSSSTVGGSGRSASSVPTLP